MTNEPLSVSVQHVLQESHPLGRVEVHVRHVVVVEAPRGVPLGLGAHRNAGEEGPEVAGDVADGRGDLAREVSVEGVVQLAARVLFLQ